MLPNKNLFSLSISIVFSFIFVLSHSLSSCFARWFFEMALWQPPGAAISPTQHTPGRASYFLVVNGRTLGVNNVRYEWRTPRQLHAKTDPYDVYDVYCEITFKRTTVRSPVARLVVVRPGRITWAADLTLIWSTVLRRECEWVKQTNFAHNIPFVPFRCWAGYLPCGSVWRDTMEGDIARHRRFSTVYSWRRGIWCVNTACSVWNAPHEGLFTLGFQPAMFSSWRIGFNSSKWKYNFA